MASKVTVKSGQTLAQIAKANNTTVAAILADPANKVLAERSAAGTPVVFNGTKVTIPGAKAPAAATPAPTTTKISDISVVQSTYDSLIAQGFSPDQALSSARYAGQGVQAGALTPETTYTSTGQAVTTPAAGAGAGTPPKDKTTEQRDAIAMITALLASYGIKDLAGPITDSVIKGYSADTIELIMQDPNSNDPLATAFQKRFPANKLRAAAGKPVISPAEYLRYERTYAEAFKQFGVPDLGTPEKFSSFIANDVSPAEVVDRVGMAVERVNNADQATKDAIKNFYPMISQSDLVRSILDPTEALPALQRKVQLAEIGGAAMAQGLKASLDATGFKNANYTNVASETLGANELAGLGLTKEEARAGYANIAERMPRAEFLSSISQGADYTQKTAEQEEFQGLASAKRARQALVETEVGRFSGSSGVNKSSLTSSKGSF